MPPRKGLRKRALYETWLLVLLTLVIFFPWHYDVSISRTIVAKSLKSRWKEVVWS